MKRRIFSGIIFFAVVVLFILGCQTKKDFNYGINKVNNLNSKYNTTMETYPRSINQIDLMLKDFSELKKEKLDFEQEQFNYVINYRTLNLEAEKLFIEGRKYGDAGTTKKGFGCKPSPLIIESSLLRNMSAQKGFQAVDLLREFIGKYPDEARQANLSLKNALFLNATFFQIYQDARRDSSLIIHFCPKNETLELYKQEFRKNTDLSSDYINNLSYEEAAVVWKRIRGIVG